MCPENAGAAPMKGMAKRPKGTCRISTIALPIKHNAGRMITATISCASKKSPAGAIESFVAIPVAGAADAIDQVVVEAV